MWYSNVHFGAPQNSVYGIFLLVAVAIVMYRLWATVRATNVLRGKQTRSPVVNSSFGRQVAKAVLWLSGLTFLFIALLQPQWHKKEHAVEQEGRDLFIALDISRSMLAQDCAPDRLTCAKEKIKKLLSALSCERVGLIVFSGSTFVQCPLTTDYAAFLSFLQGIDVETISSGTTAIDQAIKKALIAFDDGSSRKNRLLALFTDGEDFSSNLSRVKQDAAQVGMHIFTIGVGTADGAPIPVLDHHGNKAGYQKDKDGSVVISRMNEALLKNIAEESGGRYVAYTDDDSDIKRIVSAVHRYEKEKFQDKKVSLFEHQYHYFVGASFICFILEWLL